MNALARYAGTDSASTISEHIDALHLQVQKGLNIAKRRDRVLAAQFEGLLETINLLRDAAPADVLADESVRYPDDCQRIQTVLRVYCGEQRTLRECEKLWVDHSDSSSANWMRLPADDEELAACVSKNFSSNDHDILSR